MMSPRYNFDARAGSNTGARPVPWPSATCTPGLVSDLSECCAIIGAVMCVEWHADCVKVAAILSDALTFACFCNPYILQRSIRPAI